VHTDEKFADKVYSVPIRTDYLEEIIADEKPDGILLGFGGQTALNCVWNSPRRNLEKYNVRVLGLEYIASRWPTTGNCSTNNARERHSSTKEWQSFNVDAALVVAGSIGYRNCQGRLHSWRPRLWSRT